MSVLDTLITDRTQADVDAVKALSAKDMSTWTPAEVTAYLAGMKGSYNAQDLNRVGQACAYLYNLMDSMGYAVPNYTALKTDWAREDVPTQSQMTTYLSTVAAIKAVWSAAQTIPATMDNLGYEGANNIEKLLAEVDSQLSRINKVFLRSNMAIAICGMGFYPVTVSYIYPDENLYPSVDTYPLI